MTDTPTPTKMDELDESSIIEHCKKLSQIERLRYLLSIYNEQQIEEFSHIFESLQRYDAEQEKIKNDRLFEDICDIYSPEDVARMRNA